MEPKQFKIEGVIYSEERQYTQDELENLFIDWCEENKLLFGGSISELKVEPKTE